MFLASIFENLYLFHLMKTTLNLAFPSDLVHLFTLTCLILVVSKNGLAGEICLNP